MGRTASFVAVSIAIAIWLFAAGAVRATDVPTSARDQERASPGLAAANDHLDRQAPWPAPMGLGLAAHQWRTAPEALPVRRIERCRRWRDAAAMLGETFGGHVLRRTLISGRCALLGSSIAISSWEWPWNGIHGSELAPLRLHSRYGDWSIRCDVVAGRERCALVHEPAMSTGEMKGHSPDKPARTHFVIDHVAGREVMLWRLLVPSAVAGSVLPLAATGEAIAGNLVTPSRDQPAVSSPFARYRIGSRTYSEPFRICGRAGCMLEVGAARAGRMATLLAAGRALTVEVVQGGRSVGRLVAETRGFEEGLAALIRLRRSERRSDIRPR